MRLVEWSPDLVLPDRQRVTALGAFDGVHLGHVKTIRTMRGIASEHDAQATVLTFDPGPREFKDGVHMAGRRLTPLDEQLFYLRRLGVDLVIVFDFSGEIREVEPQDFVHDILVGQFRAVHVVAGPTHRFGRRGSGDIELLRTMGAQLGYGVEIVHPVMVNGDRVSSTRVRDLLDQGSVHEAGALLGRPYAINAPVVSGRGMGTEIGYPTANLRLPPEKILPRDGVYAGLCGMIRPDDYEAMEQTRAAAINIGLAPTLRGDERVVEVHVVGEQCDLEGRSLKVEFLRWLRGEQEFESIKALSEQIGHDAKEAASIAGSRPGDELREFDRLCISNHRIRRDS